MAKQRLQKLMAAAGVASRRECENIIRQGRVEIDGRVVTQLGVQVDPDTQTIKCDGERLNVQRSLHVLLNKPRGAICSATTRAGTLRAIDYAPANMRDRRLYTIGRLDVDSEGAILLTNDGELCHLVTHPRFGIRKVYQVEVEGQPEESALEKMRHGIWLAEGRTGAISIEMVRPGRTKSVLRVMLTEGKKREIRRVFARFGHEVRRLIRLSIGPVELGRLRPGETRPLTAAEVEALRGSAQTVVRLGGRPRAESRRRGPRS